MENQVEVFSLKEPCTEEQYQQKGIDFAVRTLREGREFSILAHAATLRFINELESDPRYKDVLALVEYLDIKNNTTKALLKLAEAMPQFKERVEQSIRKDTTNYDIRYLNLYSEDLNDL